MSARAVITTVSTTVIKIACTRTRFAAFAVSFPLAPCYNGTDRHIHRKENRQTNEFRLPGQTDGRNGRGSQ